MIRHALPRSAAHSLNAWGQQTEARLARIESLLLQILADADEGGDGGPVEHPDARRIVREIRADLGIGGMFR